MKKLLPIAAGLLLAGAAQAQTAVTLYGIADGDFRLDHTAIGTLKSVGSGGESASRWGLRGTEDLGNGIKAVFNFEQDFDLSDNGVPQGNIGGVTPTSPTSSTGSRLFGRRAIVGINIPSAGELRIGREYTPLYQAWSTADPFAAGTVSRATNYAVGNVVRNDNSITYESPSFSGLAFKAQFRAGEATTNTVASGATKNGGNSTSASLTYAQGPLYAGVGYIGTKNAIDNNTTRSEAAALMYDFKFFKLHGLYFHTKNATTTKQQSYAFGVTVPIQAFKIIGTVARVDNKYDGNNSTLHLNDANFFGLGGNYALSKRTDLYLVYSKIVNQGAAQYLIADNSNAGLFTTTNVPAGFNPWSTQFGVRHLF
ncbi:MAG: porin [Burkholderiaceae bacterium]